MSNVFQREIGSKGSISHHAFLIQGDETTVSDLIGFLEQEHEIVQHGNPNFLFLQTESFAIEHSRVLIERGVESGFGDDYFSQKIFISFFNDITTQAQQALLKAIEEPVPRTYFFFVTPEISTILPTILSRVRSIKNSQIKGGVEKRISVESFIEASIGKRLSMVASLIHAKSRRRTKLFLVDIERVVAEWFRKENDPELVYFLEKMPELKQYASLRGSSLKQIIEYVCLRLPIKK